MPVADPLAGRVLHLGLDVTVRPRVGAAETGATDGATRMGERLALEAGMLARRMAGDGYEVVVERQITVY